MGHGQDLAGAGFDADQCRPALQGVRARDGGVDLVLGDLLQPGVQGGPDGQPAAVEDVAPCVLIGAVGRVVEDQPLHIVAEIRGRDGGHAALRGRMNVQPDRALDGAVMRCGRDFSLLQHFVQHDVAPPDGVLRLGHGVVVGRVVDDAGEGGGLGQAQVLGVDAKVILGGRLDAVGVVVEVDDVQVALEDLVLGIRLLQGDGEFHLPDLVADRFGRSEFDLVRVPGGDVGLDDDVVHVLLGDGRGALASASRGGRQRPEDAGRVDAAVLVEPGVLDRDDALPDVGGHLVQGHAVPVLAEEGGDDGSVTGEDIGGLGRSVDFQLIGQVCDQAG